MIEFQEISWPLAGLVAARLGGMMLAAPIWNANVITFRFRIAMCFVFALAILPLVGQLNPIEFTSTGVWINLMIGELITGALFGLGVHIVFKSMMIAGELVGLPLNLRVQPDTSSQQSFGSSSNEAATATGRLFDLVAIVTFVAIGGPSFMIASMVQSFSSQPIGELANRNETIEFLTTLVPFTFMLGLKIALPVILCQWIALLTVGIISRSLPQVSTFQVGLPLAYSATLIAILFSIGSITILFGDQLHQMTETILSHFSDESVGNLEGGTHSWSGDRDNG